MKIAMRDHWGGPEVMTLREVETPVPTGDQVLVRVHASSVNRADLDWMLPKGGWIARLILGLRGPRRHTLGIDVAGTVEALGPAAARFGPGDRVFGDLIRSGMAAFAEYVCVPEGALQPIPGELPFDEAATLPHSALLAIMGLKPYWGQELRAALRDASTLAAMVVTEFRASYSGAERSLYVATLAAYVTGLGGQLEEVGTKDLVADFGGRRITVRFG